MIDFPIDAIQQAEKFIIAVEDNPDLLKIEGMQEQAFYAQQILLIKKSQEIISEEPNLEQQALENYTKFNKRVVWGADSQNYSPNDRDSFKFITDFLPTYLAQKTHQKTWADKTEQKSWSLIFQNGIQAKHFFIEKEVIELFKKTDNTIHDRQLPFEQSMLNVVLNFENYLILGILIQSNIKPEFGEKYLTKVEHITGFSFELPKIPVKEIPANALTISTTVFGFDRTDNTIFYSTKKINENASNLPNSSRIEWDSNKLNKFADTFVCNFLDYINNENPKIKVIETPTELYNKRLTKGHLVSPKQRNYVLISNTLRIYLQKIKNQIKNFSYSHRFWVRGHWRHFRSKRYIGSRGAKTWIKPFIKGHGILTEKKRKVVSYD